MRAFKIFFLLSEGKYLHENDLSWCQRHTKMGQNTIIKWFKRFRKLCCPKGRLNLSGLIEVYQRSYDGNAETFARIMLKLFGLDPKTGTLDFKVRGLPLIMSEF